MTKYQSYTNIEYQLTRQTYKLFDQPISLDTQGTARYRKTPYPVKVLTKLNTVSPEEIELEKMLNKASVIESGIYSKEQLVQERQRDLLQENMRDREKLLQEATSANGQKLMELEQLGLLETYKSFESSLRWLIDLNINGYNFRIDQPIVNWEENIAGEWLKFQIIIYFHKSVF